MKYFTLSLLTALFFFSACKDNTKEKAEVKTIEVSTEKVDFDFESFFANIAKTDNCLKEGEMFDVLGKRMDAVIKVPIADLQSIEALKQLYYKAHQNQATSKAKGGRCVDVNYAIKERVMQKFATLNNDEATHALIDLYKDTKLLFTGGEGRSLANAMTACGKAILPLLEPIQHQRPLIGPQVMQRLQSQ